MTQQVFLFVGGPGDGERRQIVNRPYTYAYHVFFQPNYAMWTNPPESIPAPKIEFYNIETFACNDLRIEYYKHADLSQEEALHKFFENYNPERRKK